MADRIFVLSNRPANLKSIYEIKFAKRGTPMQNRRAKEFMDYYENIWKDLDVHV